MKTLRVTIAIPCYKQAEYLPDAIESALAQVLEFPNQTDIIVINDGSPDNTRQIAENYGVRVINQVNKGLASARNSAIMAMRGDVLLPLDADDILMPDCVQRIVETFATTDADVVAPSFKTFGTSNETVILMANPTFKDFQEGNRIGYFSAIKKQALLECGGYSPKMDKGWEDYHLWFDLLSIGKKIVTIPEPLVLYRTKENSMWKDSLHHKEELTAQINRDFPLCLK